MENAGFEFFECHCLPSQKDVKHFLVHTIVMMMIKHKIKVFNDDHCTQDNRKWMKHVQNLCSKI